MYWRWSCRWLGSLHANPAAYRQKWIFKDRLFIRKSEEEKMTLLLNFVNDFLHFVLTCLSKITLHLSLHASIKKTIIVKLWFIGKCKKSISIELIFCWSERPRWHLWCTTCIFHPGVSSKLSHWPARVPTRPPIGREAGGHLWSGS